MVTPEGSSWSVADAKARLSHVIDQALTDGPQIVTRNGTPTVVLVSIDEWRRKSDRSGSLAEFFVSSPLRGSDLDVTRATDGARDVEL